MSACTQTYEIHDNGGRPFEVHITGKNVNIYKRDYDEECKRTGQHLVHTFENVMDVMVGRHYEHSNTRSAPYNPIQVKLDCQEDGEIRFLFFDSVHQLLNQIKTSGYTKERDLEALLHSTRDPFRFDHSGGEPEVLLTGFGMIFCKTRKEVMFLRDIMVSNGSEGNSLLIQLSRHEYIFVGQTITKFRTDDEIVSFYSRIGNNDVPYPIGRGTQYMYELLSMKRIPLTRLSDDFDFYNGFVGIMDNWLPDVQEWDNNGIESKFGEAIVFERLEKRNLY